MTPISCLILRGVGLFLSLLYYIRELVVSNGYVFRYLTDWSWLGCCLYYTWTFYLSCRAYQGSPMYSELETIGLYVMMSLTPFVSIGFWLTWPFTRFVPMDYFTIHAHCFNMVLLGVEVFYIPRTLVWYGFLWAYPLVLLYLALTCVQKYAWGLDWVYPPLKYFFEEQLGWMTFLGLLGMLITSTVMYLIVYVLYFYYAHNGRQPVPKDSPPSSQEDP